MTNQSEAARANSGDQAEAAGGSNQVLTFTLGEETYGVDILRVQEIRGWSPVTRIPQAPNHVLGVLNLRGSIVPIVDLRMRFSLQRAEYTPLTVIIVLSVESPVGRRDFGVVVDGVSDVIDVATNDVKPAPELGSHISTEFIEGLAAVAMPPLPRCARPLPPGERFPVPCSLFPVPCSLFPVPCSLSSYPLVTSHQSLANDQRVIS